MDTIQNYLAYYEITSMRDGVILFSGCFESFKTCLEQAVTLQKDLSYADLRSQNLENANLDGATLNHADFSHAKCRGINLSEASIAYAYFLFTDLRDACFCESDLSHTRFINSDMRLADIAYATLHKTVFADPSALKLDLSAADTLKDCVYIDAKGKQTTFNTMPVILIKDGQQICFFKQHIALGAQLHGYNDMPAIMMTSSPRKRPKDTRR